ncbi:MAG TPA: thiamine pyrophosphate-binding protein [Candidatus Binatia bacterium]|nr:thiamine pyrophosphate-binding protein [Candidatus Binatia bacterium]
MLTGPDFLHQLLEAGFNFFTGVPCSLVKSLIATLEERGGYIAETREDAAVGLAAGAYLAGKRPVVIMQNSGLGVCLNALASLSLIYHLPCLLLITWRGYQGKDAPEHLIMGDISPTLLDTLQVPHRVLSAETVQDSLRWAAETLNHNGRPVALLLPPGVLQ